jgi:hypothetical protein
MNAVPGDRTHAELLAVYMDAVLRGRRGSESLDEARVDELLHNCVELFRYLAVRRHHICNPVPAIIVFCMPPFLRAG